MITVELKQSPPSPPQLGQQTLVISDTSSLLCPAELLTHRTVSKYDHGSCISKFGVVLLSTHTHLKQVTEVWFCCNKNLKFLHWLWAWVVETIGMLKSC